ncbi:MAG: MATE family efflux transporter, partial [Muribaculaceae bacterium]|nr:MATE family efflux transporter [Muribaculaceae bacterium]
IWGAPALLAVMAISGWFVGVQSTFYPMLIAIVVNVINIVGSYLMVFKAGMGFPGVAWGTLLSNWLGLIIAMFCVIVVRRGKKIWCRLSELTGGGGIGRFFSVNSNLFVRSACIICVTMGVTSAGARLGALTLAVNVIVMQFFQFFSFFMDGFAFSAEAMVGRWAGACDSSMVRRVVKALLIWTGCMAVSFSLIYWGGGKTVVDLLTDSDNVRAGVNALMIWIVLIPVVSAWAFIYDGFYVGITDTRRMMIATIAATVVFYILAFVKIADGRLYLGVGNNSWVWLAFLSYLMMRGLVLAVLWGSSLRRRLGRSE